MALKACGECGTEISHRARKCPNCGVGKPFATKAQRVLDDTAKGLMGVGCAIIVLIVCIVAVVAIFAAV